MPQQLDLIGPFLQAIQAANAISHYRARKREEENPLATAMGDLADTERSLGPDVELENYPELARQIGGRRGLKPEDQATFEGYARRTPNAARQRRMQDFRTNMANTLDSFRKMQAQQEFMMRSMATMMGKGDDPQLKELIAEMRRQSTEVYLESVKNVGLGFQDLQDMPGFQEVMSGAQTQSIFGGPGAGQPMVPATRR